MITKRTRFMWMLSLLFIVNLALASVHITSLNAPLLLEASSKIKAEGVLLHEKNYFVYLSVSNDYINQLYPLLMAQLNADEKACAEPLYTKAGAHISIFYPEVTKKMMNALPFNEHYAFKVLGVVKVDIRTKHEQHLVYYTLPVESPQLQRMLKKSGLVSPEQFKLHITIAKASYHWDGTCNHRHQYHFNKKAA